MNAPITSVDTVVGYLQTPCANQGALSHAAQQEAESKTAAATTKQGEILHRLQAEMVKEKILHLKKHAAQLEAEGKTARAATTKQEMRQLQLAVTESTASTIDGHPADSTWHMHLTYWPFYLSIQRPMLD